MELREAKISVWDSERDALAGKRPFETITITATTAVRFITPAKLPTMPHKDCLELVTPSAILCVSSSVRAPLEALEKEVANLLFVMRASGAVDPDDIFSMVAGQTGISRNSVTGADAVSSSAASRSKPPALE